jgi:hypothetical protein
MLNKSSLKELLDYLIKNSNIILAFIKKVNDLVMLYIEKFDFTLKNDSV